MRKIVLVIALIFSFFSTSVLGWNLIKVTFNPPSAREDNTLLLNLASYHLYWGNSTGWYINTIYSVECKGCPAPTGSENESMCIFLENYTATDVFLVLTAIDGDGGESRDSNELYILLSPPPLMTQRGNIDTVSSGSVNRIDGYDLTVMLWYFGKITVPNTSILNCNDVDLILISADLNEDGVVDVSDLTILAANFGSSN